jgi:hypothetical protein
MFYITNNNDNIQVRANMPKSLMRQLATQYGFLIPRNSTLNKDEFIQIMLEYSTSPQTRYLAREITLYR